MKTAPVLFIIFNQPETTKQVWNTIRNAKPKKLYVVADGFRNRKPGEEEACRLTKEVIKPDWDCELFTKYHTKNNGCNATIFEALNWFFSNEEFGIILESDCLPHPDFYEYATSLLIKYKYENIIKIIGGNNFSNQNIVNESSYYFSYIPHTWGWASWGRAWKEVDFNLEQKVSLKQMTNRIHFIFLNEKVRKYWIKIYKYFIEGRPNMWDYRIIFSFINCNGLCILPTQNLVSNIGFHEGAISTKNVLSPLSNIKSHSILPIVHPLQIKPLIHLDTEYYLHLSEQLSHNKIIDQIAEKVSWKWRKKLSLIFKKRSRK